MGSDMVLRHLAQQKAQSYGGHGQAHNQGNPEALRLHGLGRTPRQPLGCQAQDTAQWQRENPERREVIAPGRNGQGQARQSAELQH